MAKEDTEEEILDSKEQKKRDKAAKKEAKRKAKEEKGGSFDGYATDGGAMYSDADDDEEDEGFSASIMFVIIFIVLIWLAILGLLIKLDIGGFGSGVLYPVLKDVPVVNKVLPDVDEDQEAQAEFETLPDALEEINRLNAKIKELEQANDKTSSSSGESEEIKSLKEEITRLRTFEDSQLEFEKLKTEFYEEVVFAENAPDIKEYKSYYEEIDPDNAEYLYKQVIQQIEVDKEVKDYVQAYTEMKPKQAAAIFEEMTDNLDLVAAILKEMDPSPRSKILGAMDSEIASQLTKIMDPE